MRTVLDNSRMHERTRRIMKVVRRKITRLVKLENEHCGHERLVGLACDARAELEGFIEDEVEALVRQVVSDRGYV